MGNLSTSELARLTKDDVEVDEDLAFVRFRYRLLSSAYVALAGALAVAPLLLASVLGWQVLPDPWASNLSVCIAFGIMWLCSDLRVHHTLTSSLLRTEVKLGRVVVRSREVLLDTIEDITAVPRKLGIWCVRVTATDGRSISVFESNRLDVELVHRVLKEVMGGRQPVEAEAEIPKSLLALRNEGSRSTKACAKTRESR